MNAPLSVRYGEMASGVATLAGPALLSYMAAIGGTALGLGMGITAAAAMIGAAKLMRIVR